MIKKILLGMTLLMSMVSCTEDFTDWANPQKNSPKEAVAFGDGSVEPVAVINLADVKTEKVKVASIVAPTSSDAAYTPTYKINFDGQSFDIDAEGNMTTADLANYIVEKWGKRPTERDIDATLDAWVSNGSTAVKMATSATFQVKAVPVAPVIEEGYPFIYFIGATDGWKSSDQKLALVDDAKGVYTGYVYLADPNGSGFQFKFQRKPGDWNNAIGAGALSTFSGAATNEGDNIGVNAGEGVYYMDVNLSEGKITATKVEKMGIIGGFNNWEGDAVMTWNAKEYCFEATNVGVTADGWKFRVNGGWDINLGGSINDLTAGGDNLSVAGNTVKLYPTRKTSEKIFCTVK